MNTPNASSVPAESQSGFGGEISKEAREAANQIEAAFYSDSRDVARFSKIIQSAIDRALSSVKEAQPKERFAVMENGALGIDRSASREAPTTQEQPHSETGTAFWMVRVTESDANPLAFFAERIWAEEWRDKYCVTASIERFDFVLRR